MNSRFKDSIVEQKFVENIHFKKIEPEIKTNEMQSEKEITNTVDQKMEQSKPQIDHFNIQQPETNFTFKLSDPANLNVKNIIPECSSSQVIQKNKNLVQLAYENQEMEIEIKPVIIF